MPDVDYEQLVEDFENALWTGQNPDIDRFIQRCPEEKRLALFMILDEHQRCYVDAVSIEIHEDVHVRIYTKFRGAASVSNAEPVKFWTIKRFFELAHSLGKQWEDLERAFSIPMARYYGTHLLAII